MENSFETYTDCKYSNFRLHPTHNNHIFIYDNDDRQIGRICSLELFLSEYFGLFSGDENKAKNVIKEVIKRRLGGLSRLASIL